MGGIPGNSKRVVLRVTIAFLNGALLAPLYNTNLVWIEFCHGVGLAELEVVGVMPQI